jgi:soluble lytic murein transglycosylase
LIAQARIALMTGLAMCLLALGPRADAQTASSPSSSSSTAKAKEVKAKEVKAKEAKAKEAKAKESKAKEPAKASKTTTAAKSAKADAKKKTAKDAKAKDSSKSKSAKAATTAKAAAKAAPPPTPVAVGSTSAADVAAVQRAVTLARQGKTSAATDEQQTISDPVARKLVEWAILRSDNNGVDFPRYAMFIAANPSWPSIGFLRRRAEATLWQERLDANTVRSFFAKEQPLTAKGRFALARALLAHGDRAGAQAQLREGWWNEAFSAELETQVIETFGNMITAADHKSRMDMRLYAEDVDGAMRSANRAGGNAVVIAKARAAVIKKAGNAKELLDGVPAEARRDVGYIFSRAQFLRRADKAEEAGELVLSLPRDTSAALDTDQWWIERRLIARKLLDVGDVKSAYRVARDAVPPAKENYRIEHQFTAGWIALRFLNDPSAAQAHFARISQGIANPISLSRGNYWQGRAAEAMGRNDEARAHYQAAAQYPTAYYGQIARARLGLKDLVLRGPPQRPGAAQAEVVRAVELLYAVGERALVTGIVADLGDRSSDSAALAAIGEVTGRYKDARAMLHVGKTALGRGLPLEQYAFPTIGIPDYKAVGPAIETSVTYAIARQESTFHQPTVSTAKAMGLMQVTPEAGRYVSKKFGVSFDVKRLLSDPVYNVQLGAAELGDLMETYRGSYILTFAGYNAGMGRVREWVARYGDPRDPNVDPIDWVERIPFSETRNYVQRVLENLQVYRVRFGGGTKLLIEADLHRGTTQN